MIVLAAGRPAAGGWCMLVHQWYGKDFASGARTRETSGDAVTLLCSIMLAGGEDCDMVIMKRRSTYVQGASISPLPACLLSTFSRQSRSLL